MHDVILFISELMPSRCQKIVLVFGSVVGLISDYIFHGLNNAFYWLCIFVLIDYITGLIQAIHNKNLSSKIGFKGIVKKIIILSIVILFHGLADIIDFPALETAVIFAFCLNELCSILENVERAGFGEIVPPSIRQILAIVETIEVNKINNLRK